MKRIIALALAMMTLFAFTAVAFAEEKITTLTTTIPSAVYTLSIPSDQTITYGTITTDIGTVKVSSASNFGAGKNLKVTVTYDGFHTDPETTTLPFTLVKNFKYSTTSSTSNTPYSGTEALNSGETLVFKGTTTTSDSDGINSYFEINDPPSKATYISSSTRTLSVKIDEWGKGFQGEYVAKIKFVAEVVVADTEDDTE